MYRCFCRLRRFLFGNESIENRNYPVLKGAVVAVGNDEVADTIEALGTKTSSWGRETAQISGSKTFNKVLFYTTGSCNDCGDMLMLNQIADCFPETGGYQIGGVPEEDCGLITSF